MFKIDQAQSGFQTRPYYFGLKASMTCFTLFTRLKIIGCSFSITASERGNAVFNKKRQGILVDAN